MSWHGVNVELNIREATALEGHLVQGTGQERQSPTSKETEVGDQRKRKKLSALHYFTSHYLKK